MRRRRAFAVLLTVTVASLGIAAVIMASSAAQVRAPEPPLPTTPFRARIVTVAESQLGYRTDPTHSYCNKYSAYWDAGSACGHGLRSEQWCADFAAWVWRRAGAQFTYSPATGDLNAAASSFYHWAVGHGTWHPADGSYVPKPGDVAVYGLVVTATSGTASAAHVAVVTGEVRGARGPDVINGDGDRTGFSVVEAGTDQFKADVSGTPEYLDGYASPIGPPATVPST